MGGAGKGHGSLSAHGGVRGLAHAGSFRAILPELTTTSFCPTHPTKALCFLKNAAFF